MDAKNFLAIKRKHELLSQPENQALPNPELEARSQQRLDSVIQPSQQQSVDPTKPNPQPELDIPPEPVDYLGPLVPLEREESVCGSGWGYSQLVKEFRE